MYDDCSSPGLNFVSGFICKDCKFAWTKSATNDPVRSDKCALCGANIEANYLVMILFKLELWIFYSSRVIHRANKIACN